MNRALPLLSPRQREVFSAVYLRPGQCLNELARTLNMPCGLIAGCVTSLETLGLLDSSLRPITTKTPRRARRLGRVVRPADWTVRG